MPAGHPGALWAQQGASAGDLQSKAPAVVFILRHAEKPMDDKDPNLTPQGFKRAQALPALFLRQPGSSVLPRLPRPAALFAAETAKHSDRPIETITPLAHALGLKINHSFEDRETSGIASEILRRCSLRTCFPEIPRNKCLVPWAIS
jgi:broad specificity phosphatase PhoE